VNVSAAAPVVVIVGTNVVGVRLSSNAATTTRKSPAASVNGPAVFGSVTVL
jgi:hypothetical protein